NRKPKRGDMIYCRNVCVGACTLVDTDQDVAMGQDVCLIRSISQNLRYLNYLMHSKFMENQLELLLVGSSFKRINVSSIKDLIVLVPPKPDQDEIYEYLDKVTVHYDRAISCLKQTIQLLSEYRANLISDIVTGKLDVHETGELLLAAIPPPI